MIREMTDEERDFLEKTIENLPAHMTLNLAALKTWCGMALSVALGLLYLGLGIAVVTMLINWGLGTSFGASTIDSTKDMLAVSAFIICIAAIMSTNSMWMDRNMAISSKQKLLKDLDENRVDFESHQIVCLKTFSDQEQGGITFFLKTDGGKTLAIYDVESEKCITDYGDYDLIPTIAPKCTLSVTHFTNSNLWLDTFSGEYLPIPKVIELSKYYADWPQDHDWVETPWDELDNRYAK